MVPGLGGERERSASVPISSFTKSLRARNYLLLLIVLHSKMEILIKKKKGEFITLKLFYHCVVGAAASTIHDLGRLGIGHGTNVRREKWIGNIYLLIFCMSDEESLSSHAKGANCIIKSIDLLAANWSGDRNSVGRCVPNPSIVNESFELINLEFRFA